MSYNSTSSGNTMIEDWAVVDMSLRKRRLPTSGTSIEMGHRIDPAHPSVTTLNDTPQQHLRSDRMSVAMNRDPQSPQSRERHVPDNHVMLTHGCLLIPVFVVAWWYWTKRKARRAISGQLRRHEEEAKPDDCSVLPSDDDFSTW